MGDNYVQNGSDVQPTGNRIHTENSDTTSKFDLNDLLSKSWESQLKSGDFGKKLLSIEDNKIPTITITNQESKPANSPDGFEGVDRKPAEAPDPVKGILGDVELIDFSVDGANEAAIKSKVEGPGSVKVNGVEVDEQAQIARATKAEGSEGKYERDDQDRVVSTTSADGSLKRTFEYGNPKDPTQVTQITENDKVIKRGNPTVFSQTGKTVQKDGLDMYHWKIQDKNGKHLEDWYGAREISPEGVYTERSDRSEGKTFQDASGKELSAEEAAKQDSDGIWPSSISVERPDGTKLDAELKGKVVEKLTETRNENGKSETIVWKRHGDKLVSDEAKPRERTSVAFKSDGTLEYTNERGEKVSEAKNCERSISCKDRTEKFSQNGNRIEVQTEDGTRKFKYESDEPGQTQPIEITTSTGGKETTWSNKPGTDEWSTKGSTEIRKNLQVLQDGAIEFTNANDVRIKEMANLERIEFDAKERPRLVTFPSGARREFTYDDQGLKNFRDYIPAPSGTTETLWRKDGESFISQTEKGHTYKRENVSVNNDGDVSYTGEDKKPHVSKVRDIDKIASGEFVLSSESMLEARQNLKDAVADSGIDKDRFDKWMKEFEDKSQKNNVSQEQVVKTFNSLSEMLTSKVESKHFDTKQRESIVDTAMHNLARPLEIDQGSHPTCNVTSVEVYAAVKHPDQYARLLNEVVLTGQWTGFDGKTYTPPSDYKGTDPDGKPQIYNSLKPGKDELKYDPGTPDSALRSLCSQVFQMTLVNAMYEGGHMNKVSDGKVVEDNTDVRYVMGPNRERFEQGGRVKVDVGEDLLLKAGKPVRGKDGKVSSEAGGPGMDQGDVLESAKLLFGEIPPHLECSGYYDDPTQGGKRVYTNHLPTEADLLLMKENGQIPILTPTMGGMHAQTIHDVWKDPSNGGKLWVLLDNQHGEPEVKGKGRTSGEGDGDGWITLDTLHNTMKMSQQGSGFGQPVMPVIRKYEHPEKRSK